MKDVIGLEFLEAQVLNRLMPRILKGTNFRHRMTFEVDREVVAASDGSLEEKVVPKYYCPTGLIMIPIVKAPFTIAMSKSSGKKYWFNMSNGQALYEIPEGAFIDFKSAFVKR